MPSTPIVDGLEASLAKMRRAGVPAAAQKVFTDFYERLHSGETGMLPERELEPVLELPGLQDLPVDDVVAGEALGQLIVVKLNGGLGTSMGLTRAKSLLEVKEGMTFLDIIVRQILSIRRRAHVRLPLVLMNSFATHKDSMELLERYHDLPADVPLAFTQNRFPRLRPDDLLPVSWPANPALEWAPPGHGDLYTSMFASGILRTLIDAGYRHAFVSNSDNLGATVEPRILAWVARESIPFLMEVADRTEADRKGGHLARRRGNGLVLRESAQTPQEDTAAFQDIRRHRFFNTNNLWLDLRALAEILEDRAGVLGLPLIVNRKPVDPSDPSTPEVIQLESAMGAAIEVFDGARALRVPRRRFSPVKTTDDLLATRSDAYVLTEDARVELAPSRGDRPPIVELDPRFYKLLANFEPRFPTGAPSLVACDRLRVVGDVRFGRDVIVRGSVTIEHAGPGQLQIADGTVLEG
jgi:UTP--glucose-1-phosphate uridylyltransferase